MKLWVWMVSGVMRLFSLGLKVKVLFVYEVDE